MQEHNWQWERSGVHCGDYFRKATCSCGAESIFKLFGNGERRLYLYKAPGWRYFHLSSSDRSCPPCGAPDFLEPFVGDHLFKKHFWIDFDWERTGLREKKSSGYCVVCGAERETRRTLKVEKNKVIKYTVDGVVINLAGKTEKECAQLVPPCSGWVNKQIYLGYGNGPGNINGIFRSQ